MTILKCPSCLQTPCEDPSRTVLVDVVDLDYNVRALNFSCDASSEYVRRLMESIYGKGNILVTRRFESSLGSNSFSWRIGYWHGPLQSTNWFQPSVRLASSYGNSTSSSDPLHPPVSVTTLQEGGYTNAHYNNSEYFLTPAVQSLFLNLNPPLESANVSVRLVYKIPSAAAQYSRTLNSKSQTLVRDLKAILRKFNYLELLNFQIFNSSRGSTSATWTEYRVTYQVSNVTAARTTFLSLEYMAVTVNGVPQGTVTGLDIASRTVVLMTLQYFSNYPLFYDYLNPLGLGGSGYYTCYKAQDRMAPWTYLTGYGNIGVQSAVNQSVNSTATIHPLIMLVYLYYMCL